MPIKYNMSLDNSGYDSDGSISWEDFFGKTTAEDLVPTLLEVYDSLVGNTEGKVVQMGLNVDGGREGESVASKFAPAKQLNPATVHHPPVTRPLSISSIASLSSSSSSSGSGSGDSGVAQSSSRVPKFWDPQLTYMDRIVLEILETERYYVTDLQQVIIGYLEFWRSSDECPLTNQQLDELFCNMKDIYHFNSSFLRALEDCGLNPVEVARCFVRNNEGFSIYTSYCTNYPRTVSLLTELMRQESMSRLFRERQIALQHTLPLGSYLLKPVQRILKYHLFLQNIVKHFSLEKDGFKDIANALSTMTAIAEHINCMKRRHEHAVRVQEIQSLLLGWQGEDLTTYGELCAEGAFRVFGAKGLRHAFLFDQMLLITKKKEEGLLAYKTHIMCSNLMLIESVPGEPQSFHVIPFDNPRLQYTLQARSLEQKRDWTLQIKRVILENYNAVIPTHARQLVMQLGQNRSDDELLAEKSTPKRQHSAPEYLERRKQERNRRKSEITVQSRFKPRMKKSGTTGSVKTPPKIGSNSFSCTREDSNLQSPADLMERLRPKRRQSEPGYYSGTSDMTSVNSSTMELSITEVKEDSKKRTIEDMIRQVLYQNSLLFRRKISRNLGMSEDEEEDLSMKFKRKNFIKRAESFNGSESSRDLDFTDSVSTHSTFDRNSPHNFSFHDVPTSPAVWLKQQRQHLASPPSKKSGSLPRSFQINPSELENRIRPITIASDKPQNIELSNRYNNENLRYCHSPALSHSDNSSNEYFISATSSNQLNVHPEYRIYREGVSKAIVKQIMSRFSSKLALLKSSSETLNSVNENKFRISQILAKPLKPMDKGMTHVVTYKQGSSSLGARIAHADYADPKELYPSIKPSEKTEALLGLNNNKYESEESEKSESLDKNFLSNCQRDKESRLDCESNESADSYYERFFESIESEVECEVFRDSAVFSDQDDAPELSSEFSCHESESETDSKPVCHKSNSISATESVEPLCHEFVPMNNHKNVNNCKVPPPVPTKPKFSPLRSQYVKNMQEVNNLNESIFYNARVSSISRGWVRHVVGKLQAIDHQSVQ